MTEKPRFIIEYPISISLGEKVLPFQGTQEYLRPMPIAEPNNELLWKALRYKGMDGFVKATAVDVFQSGWKEIKNAEMPLGPVNISAIADNNGAYIQETPLILGMGFNVSNMVQLMDIRMLECEIVVGDKKYYLNWNERCCARSGTPIAMTTSRAPARRSQARPSRTRWLLTCRQWA